MSHRQIISTYNTRNYIWILWIVPGGGPLRWKHFVADVSCVYKINILSCYRLSIIWLSLNWRLLDQQFSRLCYKRTNAHRQHTPRVSVTMTVLRLKIRDIYNKLHIKCAQNLQDLTVLCGWSYINVMYCRHSESFIVLRYIYDCPQNTSGTHALESLHGF
jgi:hypothetical protein